VSKLTLTSGVDESWYY